MYGAMLVRAGHKVHFLVRSDYDHVRQHGFKIESIWGNFDLPSVHVHRDADSLPPCDVTLVAIKTTSNASLPSLLTAPTAGGGVVLVLQNGLNIESPVQQVVPADRIYSGCSFICSNKVAAGHIHHLDKGRVMFGRLDAPADDIAERIAAEWAAAGVPIQTTDSVAAVRWRKLMWNVPFNGLSVVLDASTQELIESESAVALARRLIAEVFDAAASVDVAIDPDHREATLEATRTMVPYDSSMRLDYRAGRPLEIEAIFDPPIAASKVPMPTVEAVRDQLRFLDERNRRP